MHSCFRGGVGALVGRVFPILIGFLLWTHNFREVRAQELSLTVPSATVDPCQDYFTSEWQNPLEMNEAGDILYNLLPREVGELGSFSYRDGIVSMRATGGDPSFRLLTWVDHDKGQLAAIADDTTRFGVNRPIAGASSPFYDTLTLRMYTDQASYIQVLFEKQDGSSAFIEPVTTKAGWHTYSIDLRTARIQVPVGDYSWETTPITGIRIDPTAVNGARVDIDWIQLTPNSSRCSLVGVNYQRSVAGYTTLIVDDDTDPSNGVIHRAPLQSGAAGQVNISTSALFPGTYKVYGFVTQDFATSISQPWDMDISGTDVKLSSLVDIPPSSVSFASGKFCATTSGSDPSFLLSIPPDAPVDASKFHKLSLDVTTQRPIQLTVHFFGRNFAYRGLASILVPSSGRYNINLGAAAGWNGDIYDVRIDPGDASNVQFCVDNVTLGSSYLPTVSAPSLTAPVQVVVKERPLASLVQPDKEGGLDYFVREKGNPSNFDTSSDVVFASGLSSLKLYPGNVYTDSGGAVRMGDYIEGINPSGDGDPVNLSVLSTPLIDPELYKLVCFDLDVLNPVNVYHSVARVIWLRDGQPMDGDDIVVKTTGEKRYCLRLDTMVVEGRAAGAPPAWSRQSDGSGIGYFRVDPHEEVTPTTYRMADIRLASDHLSNNRFAFVVSGSLDKKVDVYVSGSPRSSVGGAFVGSLAAGRSSQVFVWDSSNVAEGLYYPYVVVEGATFYADAPVRVMRAYVDAAGPILGIDAPSEGYRFVNQMQVAGHALDDVRIATVEVLIDGELVASVRPSLFQKSVRDRYATFPFASEAGFNRFIDLSSLADGVHSVRVVAFDTAGNTAERSFSVVKGAVSPSPEIVYPVPNEAAVDIRIGPPPTPKPSPGALRIVRAYIDARGKAVVELRGTGAAECSISVGVSRSVTQGVNTVSTFTFGAPDGKLTAHNQLINKKAGKIFVTATRSCPSSEYNATATRALTYRTNSGRIKSLRSLATSLRKSLKIVS